MTDLMERLEAYAVSPDRQDSESGRTELCVGPFMFRSICAEAATALRQASEREAVLRKALEFYANAGDWLEFEADARAEAFDANCGSVFGDDRGDKAREALRSTYGEAK